MCGILSCSSVLSSSCGRCRRLFHDCKYHRCLANARRPDLSPRRDREGQVFALRCLWENHARDRPSRYGGHRRTVCETGPRAPVTVEAAPVVRDRLIANSRSSRCGGCGRIMRGTSLRAPVTVAAAPVVRDRLIANSRSSRCGGCGRALDARLQSAPTAGPRAAVPVKESCVGQVLALRWL